MVDLFKLTLLLILVAVVSYLVGGFNGAIMTSMSFFRKDVRKFGSGNAGLTNFARVFGTNGIVLVLLVDILKAVAAALFGRWILGTLGYPIVGVLFAGICAELGHIYPVYYRFRGGKAVLVGAVIILMTDWRVAIICYCVFVIAVIFTKYVSLGSMLAAASFPLGMLFFGFQTLDVWLSLIFALLIIFAHRKNIIRLIAGKENKLSMGSSSRRRKRPPFGDLK
ncbi:MAG: glycerol-3-phosphate acyltransferase [Oscillospiraceae bacterium]|jgi:glycerol-3-phosphate acyltransferase PlsY|nr:glycerol-3-phosphate acyltransferase [Oscillospiraceae bacterium]